MIAWIYILIASFFEVCWIYSLKFLQLKKIMATPFLDFFQKKESMLLLLPALGYVLFGVGNIIFFSKGMKTISASVSYAVWSAIALIGVKIVDVTFLKDTFSLTQALFMGLILIGIFGLKLSH